MERKPRQYDLIVDYVTNHREKLYRLAYSYVLNPDDALDIVQDSIHKAMTARSLIDEKAIKSWCYKIVVNTSLDLLRRRKRVTVVDDQSFELHDSGQEDHYQDIDLERALQSLPTDYRSVIVLRYFEDLKIEEVANVLDLNVSTVKTRLYKGLRKLRVSMEAVHLKEVHQHG